MHVSLDAGAFDDSRTDEAYWLYEAIEKLSQSSVGTNSVDPPRVVAVGERSSGKSAILRAISCLDFPVKDEFCTTFAIEARLQLCEKDPYIKARVHFEDTSKSPHDLDCTTFCDNDLPSVIEEARKCMGLVEGDLSKDILRLELGSRSLSFPLTLVDLPEYSRQEEADPTETREKFIDRLLEGYMASKSTIMLVAVTANSSLADNIALQKAKRFDPLGTRTIGVLTKPDLIAAAHPADRAVVQLVATNQGSNSLKHGWHILHNKPDNDTAPLGREDEEEKFFEAAVWSPIPPRHLGSASLRKKLIQALCDLSRASIPRFMEDARQRVKERQLLLEQLGKPRTDSQGMRNFLISVAEDFQRLARDGVKGCYADPFFGQLDQEDHKLRTQIRHLTRIFVHNMETTGNRGSILEDESVPRKSDLPPPDEEETQNDLHEPTLKAAETVSRCDKLRATLKQHRELHEGTRADFILHLFRDQATVWEKIAKDHISHVILTAKAFVDRLIKHLVECRVRDSDKIVDAILRNCVDPFFSHREALLKEKLDELLKPYMLGFALPFNDALSSALSQKAGDRFAHRFTKALKAKHPRVFGDYTPNSTLFGSDAVTNGNLPETKLNHSMISEVIANTEELSSGFIVNESFIDAMRTHYEISHRTFTENVINLAVESCLVYPIPDILTPSEVAMMPAHQVTSLAAEPEDVQKQRARFEREIKNLLSAIEQCRLHIPRPITVLPATLQASALQARGEQLANQAKHIQRKLDRDVQKPEAACPSQGLLSSDSLKNGHRPANRPATVWSETDPVKKIGSGKPLQFSFTPTPSPTTRPVTASKNQ